MVQALNFSHAEHLLYVPSPAASSDHVGTTSARNGPGQEERPTSRRAPKKSNLHVVQSHIIL